MTGWTGASATLAENENSSPEAMAFRELATAVRSSRDPRILRAKDAEEDARAALVSASAGWSATRDARDPRATATAWAATEVARAAHGDAKASVVAAQNLIRRELEAEALASRVESLARAKTEDAEYARLLASLGEGGTADDVAEIGARVCDGFEVLASLVPDVQAAIRANLAAREQLLVLARNRGASTSPDSPVGRLSVPLGGSVEALAEAAVLDAIHGQLRAYVHACGLNLAAGRLVAL